jgi:hypothetical protein
MLLITIAAGAPPPTTMPGNKIPLFPVELPAPVPPTPPPIPKPAPLSSYVGPAGQYAPGHGNPAHGPALLGPPPNVPWS